MQGFNHIAGGLTFTGLFASFHDVNVFQKPEYIALVVGASLLPDIDHTRSLIGKTAYPLAKWLSIKFGHRTLTHSFLFLLFILLIVKLFEQLYYTGNTLSILTFYALLSHNIFDMVTRQGVAFWYPFSTRPCVLPGNPDMRLRTNDLRSEAIIFVVFCCLMLFCQPLFANGFWQQYNKAFITYSHIERESRRRDDYMNLTFLNAQKDTVRGTLIDDKGELFILLTKNQKFTEYTKAECQFIDFEHSGKPRISEALHILNVSPDSIKKHLQQPILKLQLQSNTDLIYYDGVAQKSSKTIEKEYITTFDFSPEEPEQLDNHIEIETLRMRIGESKSRYMQEIALVRNETYDLEDEFHKGELRYNHMSDYEKGQWVKHRQEIQTQISRLRHELSRKLPPRIQDDIQRLEFLQESQEPEKVKISASIDRY